MLYLIGGGAKIVFARFTSSASESGRPSLAGNPFRLPTLTTCVLFEDIWEISG